MNCKSEKMSKDKLEDFIRQHRSDFDDLKAPRDLFDKIVPVEHKVHPLYKWVAVAASALLLISVGYIFGTMQRSPESIAGWTEFQEAEQYYQSRINVKMEEIKSLNVSHDVMNDLEVLDEVYGQLKNELLKDPNADAGVLLSSMIRHQQQKLKMMDEILERVEKYKSNKTDTYNEM